MERFPCIFVIQSWDKIALSMTWTELLSSILKHKFNLPSYNFDFQMEENPWQVDSVQAFSFLKCPECIFDTQEEDFFQIHAIENHPLSFVLFGKISKEGNLNESLTIEDDLKTEDTFENFDIDVSSNSAFLIEKSENPFSDEMSQDENIPDPIETENDTPAKEVQTENLVNPAFKKHIESAPMTKKKPSTEEISIKEEFPVINSHDLHELTQNEGIHDKSKSNHDTSNKCSKLISSVVKQNKPFSCSECASTFSRKSDLKYHTDWLHNIKTVQKGKKPHKCTLCDIGYGMKKNLKRHLLLIHGEKKVRLTSVVELESVGWANNNLRLF